MHIENKELSRKVTASTIEMQRTDLDLDGREVSVRSAPGAGATFWFGLPSSDGQAVPTGEPPQLAVAGQ